MPLQIQLHCSEPLAPRAFDGAASVFDEMRTTEELPAAQPDCGPWKVFRVELREALSEPFRCVVYLTRREPPPPAAAPDPKSLFDRMRDEADALDRANDDIEDAERDFADAMRAGDTAAADAASDRFGDEWEEYGGELSDGAQDVMRDVQDTFSDPDRLQKEVLGMKDRVDWWGAPPPDAEELLGTLRTVRIQRTDRTQGDAVHARLVTGWVTEWEDLGIVPSGNRVIRVVLEPGLSKLRLRRDSHVWENQDALTIVGEVLRDAGLYRELAELDTTRVSARPPAREICVQHDETDLDFVRRLLQEEGLVFAFEHQLGCERLCIADGAAPSVGVVTRLGPDLVSTEALPHVEAAAQAGRDDEVAWSFRLRRRLAPRGVSQRDFNFSDPLGVIEKTATAKGPEVYVAAASAGTADTYTFEEYPGGVGLAFAADRQMYEEQPGREPALYRLQALTLTEQIGEGHSNAVGVSAGLVAWLEESRRTPPMHAAGFEEDGRFLITEALHVAEAGDAILGEGASRAHVPIETGPLGADAPAGGYVNRFRCIEADRPFRVADAPKPVIAGLQTAVVVAPDGVEPHEVDEPHRRDWLAVDALGRVRVRFHWDRRGERGADLADRDGMSAWVRVGQRWAGGGWGCSFVPRVGTEVVVAFLNGDPDAPVVVGSVYNGHRAMPRERPHIDHRGENRMPLADERLHYRQDAAHAPVDDGPPLTLVRTQAHSFKASPKRSNGYNELSISDQEGAERMRIHSECVLSEWVGGEHTTEVAHDQMNVVQGLQEETIGAEADGGQTLTVHGKRTKVVAGHELSLIQKGRTEHVHGNENVVVRGYRDEVVGARERLQVGLSGGSALRELTVFGDRQTRIAADDELTVAGKMRICAKDDIRLAGSPMTVESRTPPGASGTSKLGVGPEGDVLAEATGDPGEVTLTAHGDGEHGRISVRGREVRFRSHEQTVRFEVDESLFFQLGPDGIELRAPRRVLLGCGDRSTLLMAPVLSGGSIDHERITLQTLSSGDRANAFFMRLKALGTPGGQDASFRDVSGDAIEEGSAVRTDEAAGQTEQDKQGEVSSSAAEDTYQEPGVLITGDGLRITAPLIHVKSDKGVNIQDEKDDGSGVLNRRLLSDEEEELLARVKAQREHVRKLEQQVADLDEELQRISDEHAEQRAKVDALKRALDAPGGPSAELTDAKARWLRQSKIVREQQEVLARRQAELDEAVDREDGTVSEKRAARDDQKTETDRQKQILADIQRDVDAKEKAYAEAAKEHDAERDRLRELEEERSKKRNELEEKRRELGSAREYLKWLEAEVAKRTAPRTRG